MKISAEIKSKLRAAYQIALRDLRACYDKKGIVAGRGHFDDYWARDSFWASIGALTAKDFSIVEKNLFLFAKKQRRNGQIPLKIGRYRQWWSFLGIKKQLAREESVFRLVEKAGHPLDPTALFIIASEKYFQKSRDIKTLKKLFESLKKAMQWLVVQDHDHDELVESGLLSDWMDSVLKKGKIFYLNVCYWQALKSMVQICIHLREPSLAKKFHAVSELAKQKIIQIFWNGQYFFDWVHHGRHGNFSSDGNILACLWGLANNQQSLKILNSIKKFKLNRDTVLKTNYPGYSWKQIAWVHILFGMKNYHDKFIWPWIGTLNILVKIRLGKIKEGLDDLKKIAEWYIKHNGVFEIYDLKGNPVRKFFYHSEKQFAWNAAMFVYVVNEIGI